MASVRMVAQITCLVGLLAGCGDPMAPGMSSPTMAVDAAVGDAAPTPTPTPEGGPVAPPADAAPSSEASAEGGPSPEAGPCPGIQPTTATSHNPGMECLSCHATISDPALRWTIAGTLWSDTYASSARAGATVSVVDSAGLTVNMVTDVYGNFYSTTAVKFPLHPSATGCATMAMMENAPAGGCNAGGCHALTQPMFVP